MQGQKEEGFIFERSLTTILNDIKVKAQRSDRVVIASEVKQGLSQVAVEGLLQLLLDSHVTPREFFKKRLEILIDPGKNYYFDYYISAHVTRFFLEKNFPLESWEEFLRSIASYLIESEIRERFDKTRKLTGGYTQVS